MLVHCEIVNSWAGYQGIIRNEQGSVVFMTEQEGCAEDADGAMASAIIRNGWDVRPPTKEEMER